MVWGFFLKKESTEEMLCGILSISETAGRAKIIRERALEETQGFAIPRSEHCSTKSTILPSAEARKLMVF